MMMDMFDQDRNGTIGFNEFAGLWQYVKEWQNVFRQYDRDRSGTIEHHELSNALSSFGYPLPPDVVQTLIRKYGASASCPLLRRAAWTDELT